jgi:hypothetical protein
MSKKYSAIVCHAGTAAGEHRGMYNKGGDGIEKE